jgi:hypothetical protein
MKPRRALLQADIHHIPIRGFRSTSTRGLAPYPNVTVVKFTLFILAAKIQQLINIATWALCAERRELAPTQAFADRYLSIDIDG